MEIVIDHSEDGGDRFQNHPDYSGIVDPTVIGLMKENKKLIKLVFEKDFNKSLIQSSEHLYHDLQKIVELCKSGQYQNIHSIIHFVIQSYQNIEQQNITLQYQIDIIFKELQEVKKQLIEDKKINNQVQVSLNSSIQSLEEQIKQLELHIKELNSDVSSYRHENQICRDKTHEYKEKYEKLLQKYQEETAKQISRIKELETIKKQLEVAIDREKYYHSELEKENDKKNKKNNEMMGLIKNTQSILEKELKTKREMESTKNTKIKELEEDISLLESTVRSNKEEINMMEKSILEMKQSILEKDNCITIQTKVNKKIGLTARKEIQEKKEMLTRLEDQLNSAKKENKEMLTQLVYELDSATARNDSNHNQILQYLTKEFLISMVIAFPNDIEDMMIHLYPLQPEKATEFIVFLKGLSHKQKKDIIPAFNYIIKTGIQTSLQSSSAYPERGLSNVPKGRENSNKQAWYFMSSNGLYILYVFKLIVNKKYKIKDETYFKKVTSLVTRIESQIIIEWNDTDILDAIQIILDLTIHLEDIDPFMEEFKLWISFFRKTLNLNPKLETEKVIKPFDL